MTAERPAATGPGYHRSRLGGAWLQLALAAVCAGYAAGAAVGWGSHRLALVMGDFGLSGAAFLAAGSCLWYAHRHGGEFGPAWALFGLSSTMIGLGNAVWGWYEVVLERDVPRISLADVCFLLFAPLAIFGLLMLARRPVTRAGWVCLWLDAWLIGGSLLTLSWSLALANTAQWQGEPVARAALALAYPLLDIALISMVLVLHFRRSTAHRSAINTAIGALALTVLCDALFTSPILRAQYSSGQLLDAGWFAGSLLLACAPWMAGRPAARRDEPRSGIQGTTATDSRGVAGGREESRSRGAARPQEDRVPAWRPGRPLVGSLAALLPYLAAAVCLLSILATSVGGWHGDRVVVFIAGTVVLALLVRQGIMLIDNMCLTRELAQKENHFRSLVQGSSDVIMIAGPDGRLWYVSPAASGVYGRDPELLIGGRLSALIHPEDLGRVVHELRRFLSVSPARELVTRIECRVQHGAGHWLNVESSVNRYHGGLIFNSRDVTERVRLQAQLQHSASHDALTDLPNRALFTERVRLALNGGRSSDPDAAVLFIDLDGFKAVNDSVGHQAGDELLVQAARRLRDAVRTGDTAARLGGDEFAALIAGLPAADGTQPREARIREIAERVRTALCHPYEVEGREVRVAASIGIAFADSGSTPAALMRNADLAMYRAKQSGKARVELYAPQLHAEAVPLVDRLRRALRAGEFALLHQPVVALADGRITAVSVQVRWRSAHGPLSPVEALRASREDSGAGGSRPAADSDDRAAEVARWMLEEAVAAAAHRHRGGVTVPVSVPVPSTRLLHRYLGASSVESLLTRHGLPPGALMLELRQGEPGLASDELRMRLGDLSRLGVRIALDGFGSGGGAMAALPRLPVDLVRLDRELIDGLHDSPGLAKVTKGLLRVASDLGIATLADAVDLPEQAAALRAMGCDRAQGRAFCEPLDGLTLRRVLAGGRLPLQPDPAASPSRPPSRSVVPNPASPPNPAHPTG